MTVKYLTPCGKCVSKTNQLKPQLKTHKRVQKKRIKEELPPKAVSLTEGAELYRNKH